VREERIDEIEQAVDAVRDSHSGLRKETGKKIFELQPAIDWHKGKALLWLLDALGLDQPDVLPIYIGDDVTDENAFRTIRSRGLGIVVKGDETEDGDRFTAARYALESPAQVQTFIATITRMKRGEKA
jgi:alpha,alpha-trehalase